MIRKAVAGDISRAAELYEHIHTEEEAGRLSTGWKRGIYPTRATVEAALQRGDFFVKAEGEKLSAVMILNKLQPEEYRKAEWLYPAEDSEVMVIHTLAVEPAFQKQGIAKKMFAFYEEYAKENGCTVLRLDTNEKNLNARCFYKSLGYRESGIIPTNFQGLGSVGLVCLEKKL